MEALEEGELVETMAKGTNDKDRSDRSTRSKSASSNRSTPAAAPSRDMEKRISKFSENKVVEVPKRSPKTSDKASPSAPTKETETPVMLDKKDVWENVRKYEQKLAEEINLEYDIADSLECLADLVSVLGEIREKRSLEAGKEDDVASLKLEGLVLLGKVRQCNRVTKIRQNIVKSELTNKRLEVDKDHLTLQNMLYEATVLKKQVESTQDYKSQDESIELIPVEEFYATAPAAVSKPEVTKSNPHLLRIARLEHEFILRQNLTSDCTELQKHIDNVSTKIDTARKTLDSVRPMLQEVLKATQPLQDFFGQGASREPTDPYLSVSQHLPQPLFILYVQSFSYNKAFSLRGGSLTVRVDGDVESAKEFAQEPDSPDESSDVDDDTDSDVDMDDNDEESSNHAMSKRSKTRKASTAIVLDPLQKLQKLHPLSVEWTLTLETGEKVNISFRYVVKLKIVTVKSNICDGIFARKPSHLDRSDSILTELFPHDFGVHSPNPSTLYYLKKVNLSNIEPLIPFIGYPFKWAQEVAGLDFPPLQKNDANLPFPASFGTSSELCSSKLENVLKQILKRLRNQVNLWAQVQRIETRNLALDSDKRSLFPPKFSASLVSAEVLEWSNKVTVKIAKLQSEATKVDTSEDQRDFYLKIVVERGRAKLQAFVLLRMNFPKVAPFFTLIVDRDNEKLDSSHDAGLQAMERELNYNAPLEFNNYPESLLVMQVLRMMTLFDTYLEASISQGSDTLGPSEFRTENLFLDVMRGRNRRQPFQYAEKHGSKMFVHRF